MVWFISTTPTANRNRKITTLMGILKIRLCPRLENASGMVITESLPIMMEAAPLQTCCMARVAIMDGRPSFAITKPLTELTNIQTITAHSAPRNMLSVIW